MAYSWSPASFWKGYWLLYALSPHSGSSQTFLNTAQFFLLQIKSNGFTVSLCRKALQMHPYRSPRGRSFVAWLTGGHMHTAQFIFASICYVFLPNLKSTGILAIGQPFYSLSLFVPSISKYQITAFNLKKRTIRWSVAALGFTNAKANLLSAAPYALGTVFTLLVAYLSDKYTTRAPVIAAS